LTTDHLSKNVYKNNDYLLFHRIKSAVIIITILI
jgi:hypothetical protein